MKHTLGVLITTFLLLAATTGKCQEATDRERLVLALIIDTSWSCGQEIRDFRTLGQQAREPLEPGDYIEIIAAYGTSPRMVLAHEITGDKADDANKINAALRTVSSRFLSDGTISTALARASKRLTAMCEKDGYDWAAVVVLTDGQIDDKDATRIIALAKDLKARGWPLYMTGNDNTNSKLLIAGTNATFTWSRLDQANPSLFLRQFRQQRQTKAAVSTEDDRALDPVVAPLPPDISPAPPTPDESGTDGKRISNPAETPSGASVHPPAEEKPAEKQDRAVLSPPIEPNEPAEQEIEEELPAVQDGPADLPSDHNRIRKLAADPRSWIIAVVAIGASTLLLAVLVAMRRASRIAGPGGPGPGTRKRELTGPLVVTVNGQSYPLGPYQRFSSIHLGRGVGNTIKRSDEGIDDRHLRLFKKGADLMIHNLSKTPLVAGGKTVRPGHKEPLTLPTTVQITEKIRMTVAVVKPKTEAAKGGESHGNQ